MPNAKDIQMTQYPRVLIIGDSGTFKTGFLSTIPDIYVFDFDRGMAIARGKDIEYDTFKDAPRGARTSKEEGIYKYGAAWPAFIARLNGIGTQIDKSEWNSRPIAVDSLTTMANSAMAYVLLNTNHTGIPQIQHWGAQMNLIETTMDQLNSWPVPLFVTAHIQRNTNDLTQVIEMLPLVTGKLAGKIGLYFDEIWYTRVKGRGDDRKFIFQTNSDSMYKQAKTRWGVEDESTVDWNAVKKFFQRKEKETQEPEVEK